MDDALDAGFGQLCVSAGWRLSGVAFGSGLMCEWWLAHCGVGGVLVRWRGRGNGCFPRLLCFGSVGESAMCEWWLAHCGAVRGVRRFGYRYWRLCVSGGWHIAG